MTRVPQPIRLLSQTATDHLRSSSRGVRRPEHHGRVASHGSRQRRLPTSRLLPISTHERAGDSAAQRQCFLRRPWRSNRLLTASPRPGCAPRPAWFAYSRSQVILLEKKWRDWKQLSYSSRNSAPSRRRPARGELFHQGHSSGENYELAKKDYNGAPDG